MFDSWPWPDRAQPWRDESAPRQPHLLEGLGAGVDHLDGVGIGHAHILAGKDKHTAEDEGGDSPA